MPYLKALGAAAQGNTHGPVVAGTKTPAAVDEDEDEAPDGWSRKRI